MNTEAIIKFIQCPICEGELSCNGNVLLCSKCKREYKVKNEIPVLVPNDGKEWINQVKKDMVVFDNYFKKRIDQNNGWWILNNLNKYEEIQKKYNFNRGRLKVIGFLSKNVSSNSLIVDLGGGEGYVSNVLQTKYPEKKFTVIEQDISNLLQNHGRIEHNADSKDIFFLTSDTVHSGIKSNIADAVFSTETIEHIRNVNGFVKEAKRILKKDGYFIITTPNNKNLFSKIEHYSRKAFYTTKSCFSGKNNKTSFHDGVTDNKEEGYEKILTCKKMKELLKENNFVILNHECHQFLGDFFFNFSRRIKIPSSVIKVVVKIIEPIENSLGKHLGLSEKLGCTQIVFCKKIDY